MKRIFVVTGICALLAGPAIAQDEGAPTAEEVNAAVETINAFAEDESKVQGYCDLLRQMDSLEEGEEDKVQELSNEMNAYLESNDVLDAFSLAESVDPASENGQKVDAAFAELDQACLG